MDDAQKIALIASFLLRYPDESWYNELGEWKEDTYSVCLLYTSDAADE